MKAPFRHWVSVFLTKLRYNLKSEASATYLGYAWWLLEPALYVGVLYLVFGTFRDRGGTDFVIFLITGMLPYLWFQKSVTNSALAIRGGRGLINQIAIHKAFFPLLVVAQDLIKQAFVFVLMFVLLLQLGLSPQPAWAYFPFLALVQLLVVVAGALMVASITPFIPDFRYIIATGMTLVMLMSGIFFDYERYVLPQHQTLFLLNPMARLLKNYRQVLIDGAQPDWLALSILALVCIGIIAVMFRVYRLADTAFARSVT